MQGKYTASFYDQWAIEIYLPALYLYFIDTVTVCYECF